MSRNRQDDLIGLVTQTKPRSILAIGPQAEKDLATYLTGRSECRLDTLAGDEVAHQLDRLGTYDLVYVAGVLEHLDKTQAGILIAKLRDLHARRLVAAVPIGHPWQETDLLAYGLHCIGRYRENDEAMHLYEFDIATYKTTPDWLNNKYWAHPELFNKFRW